MLAVFQTAKLATILAHGTNFTHFLSMYMLYEINTSGEMECRMGDFVSSGHTLDQALAECPTYGRAREVR